MHDQWPASVPRALADDLMASAAGDEPLPQHEQADVSLHCQAAEAMLDFPQQMGANVSLQK
eukprot:8658058-Alexandrium_andersonii.AAC.1